MPAADSAPPTPTPDHAIAVIDSYEGLLATCRAQVQRLNINYEILDIAAGFTVGYASKLFAASEYCSSGGRRSKRHFSSESFDAYLEALGFDLVAVENPDKIARLKRFCESRLLTRAAPLRAVGTDPPVVIKLSRGFMKRIARLGGLARARKLRTAVAEKERISERNRRNVLERWRRAQVTSGRPADPGSSDDPPPA